MVKFATIPEQLIKIYNDWGSIQRQFYIKAKSHEDYFYNDTEGTDTAFSKEQLKRIEKYTGITTSVNRLYSITSQAIAYLTRKKVSNRLVAVQEKFKNHAIVLDKIKQGIYVDSLSIVAEEESIKDQLITGIGIKTAVIPNNEYMTIFPAYIEHVYGSDVILDVNCTDRTLKRMRGYWIDKEITLYDAKEKYQYKIDKIKELYEPNIDWTYFTKGIATIPGTDNRRTLEGINYDESVHLREYHDKIYTSCYLIEDKDLGIRKLFKENLYEEQLSLLNNPLRVDQGLYERTTTMLGDHVIDVTINPVTEWLLNVKFFEWGGKPYKSKGFIHFGKGLQQGFDSLLHLMIAHGFAVTNSKYMMPRTSIKESDRKNLENDMYDPSKPFLYDPVMIGNEVLKPERMQPGQISNFYPVMLEMLVKGMYEVTGLDPILLGVTTDNSVDTFAALSKYESAALQRIMLQMDHISLAQQQEGTVLIELITSELKPSTAYTFLDAEGKINEVQLTIEAIKETKLAKYKLYAIPHEAMPTQRLQTANELLKIAQTSTDISEKKTLMQKAFKLQDIPELDDIIEQLDEVKNLNQVIEQMQTANKRQAELYKQMENRALNAEENEKLLDRLIESIEKIAKAEAAELKKSEIVELKEEIKVLRKNKNSKES